MNDDRPTPKDRLDPVFPIAGIGASAGGLEALTELVKHLPVDSGMAFVVVQHLDPSSASILAETLGKQTSMPVVELLADTVAVPNQIHVAPPGFDLVLRNGTLTREPRSPSETKPHFAIDILFRSLAESRGPAALGVVLSGTGSDGTLGLRAIKAEGGITLAQAPASARFDGMPSSAIQAGVVDFVRNPAELAAEIAAIAAHPHRPWSDAALNPLEEREREDLATVLALVRHHTRVDFGEYKEATVRRRIARRLALHRIASLHDYAELLRGDPAEAQAVFEDILIHVTSFFRDPEAFDALKADVFPLLTKDRPASTPVRIWSAGCSTGEEVYSLAISFLEFTRDLVPEHSLQVFGGDLSARAIEVARAGIYRGETLEGVSEERLERYFTKVDGGYRVSKKVRDACVFSRHDLARDPPFSRLDLISCRNVLIYFAPPLQARVVSAFHHSLNQPGFLLVGRSESLSDSLFSAPKGSRIYARVPDVNGRSRPVPLPKIGARVHPPARTPLPTLAPEQLLDREVDTLLLSRYSPAAVLVDERMEILQFRGHTGPWLEPASGEPQRNLLKMARPGLLADIRIGISTATETGLEVVRPGVVIEADGISRSCRVVVLPLKSADSQAARLFLVLFEETTRPTIAEPLSDPERKTKVELELQEARAYLQSLIEEHQQTNDDLAASNAELLSNNEELQSLNEEMETAKEELQSTNEELNTVNSELQSTNTELHQANNDLVNILASVEIPILLLDAELRLRRFTPKARAIMNVLPTDIGRPIADIRPNVNLANLEAEIALSVESNSTRETDVKDRSGKWHRLQIRPYKTTDNRIDGAVVTLLDIDALKRAVTMAEWARDYARDIVESVPVPLIVLDATISVLSANAAFYKLFGGTPKDTDGKSLYAVNDGFWGFPELQALLGDLHANSSPHDSIEVEREVPKLGRRVLSISARPILRAREKMPMVLVAIDDLTDQRRLESQRSETLAQAQVAKADAEDANRAKDFFLAVLSHELRTPLNTLVLQSQLLRRGSRDVESVTRAAEAIERAAGTQARLIEDLLDISRMITGKFKISLAPIEITPVVLAGVEAVSALAKAKGVRIETHVESVTHVVNGDAVRLQQVVWNLLNNAIKFTPRGGRVVVTLEAAPRDQGTEAVEGRVRLRIEDNGAGIERDFLPHVFERFAQAETSSSTRSAGGLGLGLAIVRTIVEMHHGSVAVDSKGKGHGATFTVELPIVPVSAEKIDGKAKRGAKRASGKRAPRSAARTGRDRLLGFHILVVEDDPDTRDAVEQLLTESGATVAVAGSAPEALAVSEERVPDLLLLDIGLPGEDGYSLLRKLHARDASVPAIAMTAFASTEDRRRALEAGFACHLAKPLDAESLLEAVRGCLESLSVELPH